MQPRGDDEAALEAPVVDSFGAALAELPHSHLTAKNLLRMHG